MPTKVTDVRVRAIAEFRYGTPTRIPVVEERCFFLNAWRKVIAALSKKLYQVYSNPLYSYAFKMLGDQGESEEVLQDTFVRLWKKAAKFRPDASKPFTWTIMILRGLCLDRLRKRNVRSRVSVVEVSIIENMPVAGNKGIERLHFSELTRKVRKALHALNEEERRCVDLAIFGDATHPEIAEKLGQPLGTVKSRIRRGLIKLREHLKDIHD